GRRVEEAMLRKIIEESRKHGIHRLIGIYVPTAKNCIVSDHYTRLGFSALEEFPTERCFRLEIECRCSPELPFKVIDNFTIPPTSSERADSIRVDDARLSVEM